MRLVSRKAWGSAHRVWERVAPTDHPWAFWIAAGWPVMEADGRRWSSAYPVVGLFWPDRFYQVFLLLKDDATEYYCNLITPPVYRPGERVISFVDLDLDVVIADGRVQVLDEDEYALRRRQYPEAWQTAVTQASAELIRLANERRGPFSTETATRWRQWSGGRRAGG